MVLTFLRYYRNRFQAFAPAWSASDAGQRTAGRSEHAFYAPGIIYDDNHAILSGQGGPAGPGQGPIEIPMMRKEVHLGINT